MLYSIFFFFLKAEKKKQRRKRKKSHGIECTQLESEEPLQGNTKTERERESKG